MVSSSTLAGTNMMEPVVSTPGPALIHEGQLVHVPGHRTGIGVTEGRAAEAEARRDVTVRYFMIGMRKLTSVSGSSWNAPGLYRNLGIRVVS